jgi:ubiquinone/menaquinone biosynthesis C-methylase UbiE
MPDTSNNPKHYAVAGKQVEHPKMHSEHLTRMVEYYSQTANVYDTWNFSPNNPHDYGVKFLLEAMRKEKMTNVLDVCCGTGRAISAALEAGFDAYGIDISPSLIAEAVSKRRIPQSRIHYGDATKLPFADKSFDASCILGALHHTMMPHTIIEEMIRVTRKLIVISDCGNDYHGGIRAILMKLGIFTPVYRLLFKREPKTVRRQLNSAGDGPTFDFSLEEIVPDLAKASSKMKFLTFYGQGTREICSSYFPRLFAKHIVITCHLRQ